MKLPLQQCLYIPISLHSGCHCKCLSSAVQCKLSPNLLVLSHHSLVVYIRCYTKYGESGLCDIQRKLFRTQFCAPTRAARFLLKCELRFFFMGIEITILTYDSHHFSTKTFIVLKLNGSFRYYNAGLKSNNKWSLFLILDPSK